MTNLLTILMAEVVQ